MAAVVAVHANPDGLAENAVRQALLEAGRHVAAAPSPAPACTLSAYEVPALNPVKVWEVPVAGDG